MPMTNCTARSAGRPYVYLSSSYDTHHRYVYHIRSHILSISNEQHTQYSPKKDDLAENNKKFFFT